MLKNAEASLHHFGKLFQKAFSCPPRVLQARLLLATSMSVGDLMMFSSTASTNLDLHPQRMPFNSLKLYLKCEFPERNKTLQLLAYFTQQCR